MNVKTKIIYFLKGGLLVKVFGLFSFLFMAKVVTLDTFALYTMYLFASEILIILLTVGLNSYIMRNSNIEVRLKTFSKAMYLIFMMFVFFGLAVALIPNVDFIEYRTIQVLFEYKYYIFLIIFCNSYIKMILGYLVSNHIANNHMKVNFIKGVSFLSILLINYYIVGLQELDLIFISLLLSGVVTFTAGIFLIRDIELFKVINRKEIIDLISESYAFMLKNLIGILGLYLSRLVLEVKATQEELAIYSFYLVIIFQMSFFTAIVKQAIIPTIRDNFEKLESINHKLKSFFIKYGLISIVILIVTFIIASYAQAGYLEFLEFFVKRDYLDHSILFVILLVSFFIGNMKSVYDVWQYHEVMDAKKKIIYIALLEIVLGVILYPLFYDMFQVYGIAISYVLIVTIFTLISYYYFEVLKVKVNEKNLYNR